MKHIDDVLSDTPQPNPSGSSPERAEAEPDCPICGGIGFLRYDVPVGHANFGKVQVCDCRQSQRQEKRIRELRAISNLDALIRYTFESFTPDGYGLTEDKRINLRLAYETAHSFALDPQGWLIFLGNYGCGKTHLAAAIANHIVQQGTPALFVVVPDLLDYLRATYSPHQTVTYDERFNDIRNASILILDDLGAHSSTPWAQEKLFQILNYRYNARLPTVVTSNHELEEIDIRVRSRMIDPDLARIITITAPDFRQSGVVQSSSELSSLSLHADQTFDSFEFRDNELSRDISENLRRVYAAAKNYAKEPQNWVAITGTYGCGKTHLAAAIANEQVRRGDPALFVVVPDLLDHLRATFYPSSPTTYDKRFDSIRKSPLLVLDDLGTESATPWAEEKLYQLFNYRYNARLATVITIAKQVKLQPRLKSLILDVGRCTTFEITAPSYRDQLKHIPPTKNRRGRR